MDRESYAVSSSDHINTTDQTNITLMNKTVTLIHNRVDLDLSNISILKLTPSDHHTGPP